MWWRRLSRGGLCMSGGEAGLGANGFASPGACSLRESPSGIRPDSRPTFFASPKKVGKERRPGYGAPSVRTRLQARPSSAGRTARRCCPLIPLQPAVLGTEGSQITRPRTASRLRLGAVLGARTDLLDAAARRNLPSLRSSAPYTGKVKSKRLASPRLCALRAPAQRDGARFCVGHLFRSRIRRRGAQGLEGCAAQRRRANLFELRAPRLHGCSVVFEGELFARLPAPSTAGNPRQGAPYPGRLSFAYFSLAKQRKVGRLSGRTPDGLSRMEPEPRKTAARQTASGVTP